MNITLCLLVRNEEECLKVILPTLPEPSNEAGFNRIVAVDGNSTDGTVATLAQFGIPVIAKSPRGRGEGFQRTFANDDADAFVFFSPDGNEDSKDLPRFRALFAEGADIVIASRMMKGAYNEEDGQLFKWRKWANLAFNALANFFFRKSGPYITDTINGYRGITRHAINRLALDAPDYTIEYQMSIRALRAGLNIREFPTYEGQRIAGETGASSIPTGLRFLRRLWIELRRPSQKAAILELTDHAKALR